MGLLLLLTFTLLSSYLHPGSVVNAQQLFTIREITLSIEPSTDVIRNTNVTLRCQAVVSSSGQEALSREYTIYKDGNKVYTKTSSTSEDLLYHLLEARVSNTGKYKCMINIEGKHKTSEAKKLTVTGLSKPLLQFNKGVVSEGEEITARCVAPGETGSIFFYFFEGTKDIAEEQGTTNQAVAKFHFSSAGIRKVHCAYTVLITPDSVKSVESDNVTVSVRELPITAVLEIFPRSKIYEGDQLDILCSVRNVQYGFDTSTRNLHLFLSQGSQLLSSGKTRVNHSMVALAKDPGEFECRVEMEGLVKLDSKKISVTELFSVPTLTMSPAEVFQREHMVLTCKSESTASERLGREELTYTLDPPKSPLIPKGRGVFAGNALLYDFNYTCAAQAKGIVKQSEILTVRPKVSVSAPNISVVNKAILGQPVKILCQSDIGSLPINYTLFRGSDELSTYVVKLPSQKALFTVNITKPDEISKYMCKAKNSHKYRDGVSSRVLNTAVTVPLTQPTLTVIPNLPEISEGDHLYLICGVKGTPPVTFKWYREGHGLPLNTTITNKNNTDYQVPALSKEHSGTYHCEAQNYANRVRSDPVTIEVRLALWKKVVIGGFCLLAVSVLVVVVVLCFRSKRVRVDNAAVSVWSERPPEAASDEESSMESNEPDVEYTEVVHPRPVDPARGATDHHDYGSVEYAELNSEQPEINHYHPEVNNHQDLPVPLD